MDSMPLKSFSESLISPVVAAVAVAIILNYSVVFTSRIEGQPSLNE